MGESLARVVGKWYYDMYRLFDFSDLANIFSGGKEGSVINQISNSLSGLAGSIGEAMVPIALAIALLFFFISLIEFAMSDRLTIESFIKFFAKLAIAAACICYCTQLTTAIEDFGEGLSTLIAENADYGGISPKVLEHLGNENAKDLWGQGMVDGLAAEHNGSVPLGAAFGLLLETILPFLIFSLVGVIVSAVLIIIGFSRFLELSLRAAFMPIAIALISDDGWRGAAGRYIRKFIAICAQGAVLTVLMNILQGGIPTCFGWEFDSSGIPIFSSIPLFTSIVYVIGFSIAVVSIMFKSIGIINDVFGA